MSKLQLDRRTWLGLCATTPALATASGRAEESTAAGNVLIVVGPSQHPPGTHEVEAGARLMKHCIDHAENIEGLKATIVSGWPDEAWQSAAKTIVFIGDLFPPAKFADKDKVMRELSEMMNRGVGMLCVHYATGLGAADVPEDGNHPLLHWTGGYFATRCKHHQSVAKLMTATIEPGDPTHPINHGWQTFTLDDEPYYNNYFGKDGPAPGVKTIATSMLPPGTAAKKEIVGWAIERKDGGRGVGVVMPHYFRSWKIEDLRKLIMNGIAWTAKKEIPQEGIRTSLPDLASFKPAAVEPKIAKKSPK